MSHWCRDIPRDEAVRAAEDNRQGPLPTLADVIAEPFADEPKRSAAVSKTGEVQSGLRTERVTLEITHDLDAPLGDWIVQVIDESLGYDETVRVVEEAKLAPAANADGGSNHAAPAASGAAGTKPVAWAFVATDGAIVHVSTFEPVPGTATVVPLYAAPQPASGWLSEKERGALKRAFDLLCDDDGDNPLAGTVQKLLARSSPPEVVLEDFTPDAVRNLDTKYLAGWDQCMALAKRAISAAGVKVKEVG